MTPSLFPNWREKIVFSADGPKPQVLADDEKIKVVLVGLEAGMKLPPHPEGMSVFHILEGEGFVVVDDTRFAVQAGSTVITPHGATRGIEAKTRLAVLAVRVPL